MIYLVQPSIDITIIPTTPPSPSPSTRLITNNQTKPRYRNTIVWITNKKGDQYSTGLAGTRTIIMVRLRDWITIDWQLVILSLINLGTILLIVGPDNSSFRIWRKLPSWMFDCLMFVSRNILGIGGSYLISSGLQLWQISSRILLDLLKFIFYIENKSFIDNLDWNFRLSFTNVKNKQENCFLFFLYLSSLKRILFEIWNINL